MKPRVLLLACCTTFALAALVVALQEPWTEEPKAPTLSAADAATVRDRARDDGVRRVSAPSDPADSSPHEALPERSDREPRLLDELPDDMSSEVTARFEQLRGLLEKHRPEVTAPDRPKISPANARVFLEQFTRLVNALDDVETEHGSRMSDLSTEQYLNGDEGFPAPEPALGAPALARAGQIEGLEVGAADHVHLFNAGDGWRLHVMRHGQYPELDTLGTLTRSHLDALIASLPQLLGYFGE